MTEREIIFFLDNWGHYLAPTTTTTSRTTTTSTSTTSTSSTDTASPASTSQTSGSMVVYCDSNFLWLRLCVDMFRFSHFSFRIQYGVEHNRWSCGMWYCHCDCICCCHCVSKKEAKKAACKPSYVEDKQLTKYGLKNGWYIEWLLLWLKWSTCIIAYWLLQNLAFFLKIVLVCVYHFDNIIVIQHYVRRNWSFLFVYLLTYSPTWTRVIGGVAREH